MMKQDLALCFVAMFVTVMLSGCCCGALSPPKEKKCVAELLYTGPSAAEEPYKSRARGPKSQKESFKTMCFQYCMDADPKVQAKCDKTFSNCQQGRFKRFMIKDKTFNMMVARCTKKCISDLKKGRRDDFKLLNTCH